MSAVAGGGFVVHVVSAARSPFFCMRWMQRAAMRALYCTEDATNNHCSGSLPSPSRVDCLRAAILWGVYISMIRAGAWFGGGGAWPKRGLCSLLRAGSRHCVPQTPPKSPYLQCLLLFVLIIRGQTSIGTEIVKPGQFCWRPILPFAFLFRMREVGASRWLCLPDRSHVGMGQVSLIAKCLQCQLCWSCGPPSLFNVPGP